MAVLNTIVDVALVLELMAFAMRARDFATKKGDAVKVVAMLKYVVMASPHLQNIIKTFNNLHVIFKTFDHLNINGDHVGDQIGTNTNKIRIGIKTRKKNKSGSESG